MQTILERERKSIENITEFESSSEPEKFRGYGVLQGHALQNFGSVSQSPIDVPHLDDQALVRRNGSLHGCVHDGYCHDAVSMSYESQLEVVGDDIPGVHLREGRREGREESR